MTASKKITLATIKSFIRKNLGQGNLYIKGTARFDGMVDMVTEVENPGFFPAERTENWVENSLGVAGAWFVGGSRNSFQAYDDGLFTGYRVYNCCATFILAVAK